ncbi:hypothetical protein [Pseudomonas syringae]|uniref:hypothetical protein n=1 Tax=Pseudomonas syringae TaxID=317 RepID=UPI001F342CA3|nr:hypothetical protein [Pseudomonas syringae]MCF5371332.1 hypothetical protein [Pseudomonas syringae]MCF5382071.1 hypothetical protein [Pseudomonas syringae]MCF5419345.1 hypothetical protein [Pseudomonas syringae]MCF5454475.1 hypothetical protein [Pseudomonas syringae]MCF5458399.1 hypothetical protein [Pseudomonas syringae]
MQKITLAAITVALLAGCASAPAPAPKVSTYNYKSKEHSGTVTVTDKQYSNEDFTCDSKWREAEVYTPKGIVAMGHDHLKITIDLSSDVVGNKLLSFEVPQDLGNRVFAKDYQESKSFMLGTEKNGLIQQGEHFFYPQGYYVRVSAPSVQGDNFVSCIGIDYTYVMDADLQSSTNPPVHLDRVVVPFAVNQENQPVKVSFGSGIKHTAEIRVLP